MEKQIQANKERVFGLYTLALARIKECEKFKGQIIPFPKVFEKICRSFSIKKKEAWELLYILNEFNFIEIKAFHGVVLKNEWEKGA